MIASFRSIGGVIATVVIVIVVRVVTIQESGDMIHHPSHHWYS